MKEGWDFKADQEMRLLLNIDADAGKLEKLTLQLQKDLKELDVKAYQVSAGKVPERVMAGEPVIWGTLLVTISLDAIKMLIGALQSWLSTTTGSRGIDIEICGNKLKITGGISSKERQRLIDSWIASIGECDQ